MKRKLLSLAVLAMTAGAANAQYCGGGPSSTIDSNLEAADLVGESSSISYTGCPGVTGVEDATAEMADLFIGSMYSTDLHWGTCGGAYSWAASAWIDFDGSGTYDPDELVADETGFGDGGTMTYSFTVPGDAVEGATRMRVVQRESGSLPLDPCGSFSWGSAVEFSINLETPCEELVIDVTDTELCGDEEVTLDAEGVGTITWTGGVEDEVPFSPGEPGVYSYIPSSDDPADCPTDESDAVTIEVFGPPVVIAGAGDLNFCEDEMITLSAAGDADIYTWNDGEDLELMPGPGSYTFTLEGEATSGGCAGDAVTDEVTVTVHSLPTITASSDADPICIGNSIVLNGGGGVEYEWDIPGYNDGDDYTPAEVGTSTYSVWGVDENGCAGMASVDVEVVEGISISGTTVIETAGDDGEIDITVTGGAPSYSFDWDNDGTGDFDDDEDLTGLSDGFYTVVVQGAAGCESTETFELRSQLSIEDLSKAGVSIYPNPTTSIINVEMAGNFEYQLIAINGDVLVNGVATDKEVLDLDIFANGVYFVKVKSDNAATTIKVVKK